MDKKDKQVQALSVHTTWTVKQVQKIVSANRETACTTRKRQLLVTSQYLHNLNQELQLLFPLLIDLQMIFLINWLIIISTYKTEKTQIVVSQSTKWHLQLACSVRPKYNLFYFLSYSTTKVGHPHIWEAGTSKCLSMDWLIKFQNCSRFFTQIYQSKNQLMIAF